MVVIVVLMLALLLAFANGANDNAKPVATLVGGRTMSMGRAVWYAAAATGAGSIAAIWLGVELAEKFKGHDIVAASVYQAQAFAPCVAAAAAVTVLAATRIGMPVSTTHAMVGSIMGIAAAAGALDLTKLWTVFFRPLAISPFVAAALAALLYILFRYLRGRLGVTRQTCVCIEQQYHPVSIRPDGTAVLASSGLRLGRDEVEQCRQRYGGSVVGVDAQRALDSAHTFTAGALCFARGLNDTPKIAAVMIALGTLPHAGAIGLTAAAIALGGLIAVRRVARTMSYRITAMNDGQAFTGNLVAAVLVILATKWGLPVSTTHVTCGSLFGIGAVNREANWKMIGQIVLAWVTTLPVAAALGYAAWYIIGAGWGN